MKKALSLVVVLMLVLALFAGCGDKNAEITIKDQQNSVNVKFESGLTVEEILANAGVVVKAGDKVEPALDTKLDEAVEIVISRYAKVNVTNLEGKTVAIELVGSTVADALKEAGIVLDDTMSVNFDTNSYLSDIEGDIVVTLKGEGEATTEESTTVDALAEVTTEEETTTEPSASDNEGNNNYSEDDDDDYYYTTTTRPVVTTEPPTYVRPTEGETAPPVDDPIVTESAPPATSEQDSTNGGDTGEVTERYLVRTEYKPDCDENGGYYIYYYSDGSVETEIVANNP